jgi:hypothetical protein
MKLPFVFALFVAVLFHTSGVFAQDDVTWERVSTLPAGYVIGMEHHPTLGNVALSIGGKIFHSLDSGKTWIGLNTTISQASGMTADALDPTILYAATRSGVYASADGKDWDPIGLTEQNVRAIDIASGQNVIMVATLQGIFFSSDRGLSWDERNDSLPKNAINCIDAGVSNYTFVGTKDGLFMHQEIDFDWRKTALYPEDVTALRINGSNGNAWAGTTSAIYSCDNFESAWTHRFTTPAEVTFIWNPAPAVLAGATNNLFYSSNNGGSWKPASNGIMTADVTCMMTSEDQHILLATKDGSIYKSKEVVGSKLSVKMKGDDIACEVTPKPVRDRGTLTIPRDHSIESISIVDMTGREVQLISVGSGSRVIDIPTSGLPSGAYSLLMHTSSGMRSTRMLVQH